MAVLGTLEVHLLGGKNLKHVDFIGKNDPYVILSYKSQDQKSKTLEGGGSDPVWDQSFFFEIDEDIADVIIKIFDEDKHTADDVIGEARISLEKVLSAYEVSAAAYDLILPSGDIHGQIEVSLNFVPKEPEQVKPCPPPSVPHHHNPHHHNPQYGLHHHTNNNNGPYSDNSEGGWQ